MKCRTCPHMPHVGWCPECNCYMGPPSEHHAARNEDPETSHKAVRTRAPKWDTMNGIALRIHAEHPAGLTHWEVQEIAEKYLGQGALGKSPWKRSGELFTEWNPPLIAPLRDASGEIVTRPGEFGDAVEVFQITPHGVSMVARTRGSR